MRRLLFTTSVLALTASAFAQSWSPLPKFQSEAGGGYELYFGRYSGGRYQFADGNFRNSALVVTKLSMRVQPTHSYSDYYRMGRSWTNVNIDISPCDLTTVSTTFSSNPTSTPTSCFSGAMSWPTLPTGVQSGGINSYPIQASLTTPYINSGAGTDDMLIDFQMTGGVLANNATWASTTSFYYYKDSYVVTSALSGEQRFFHDTTGRGCVDSNARPLYYRSYTYQYLTRYAPGYPTASYANKLYVYNYSYYMAPNSTFTNVVDFAVNPSGVPFGAGCEKLYLAVSPSALFFPGTTNASGSSGQNLLGIPGGLVPYNPAFLGAEVFTQSAWNDSVTGELKLSAASSAKVPELGITSNAEAKRVCVFQNTHGPTGVKYDYYYYNPIIRYN